MPIPFALTILKPLTIDGFKIVSLKAPGGHHLRQRILRADYENAERASVRHMIQPGDRVLEGGGGIGIVTMNICRIVGADNLLVYEPLPTAAVAIRRNGAANGMKIRVVAKALSDRNGAAQIAWRRKFPSATIMRQAPKSRSLQIETESIGDAIAAFKPNVLVLDVEGKEVDLLRTAPLAGIDLAIVEVHPDIVGDREIEELHAHLTAQGFRQIGEWTRDNVVTFAKPSRTNAAAPKSSSPPYQ